jgi:hypothetical protein
MYSKVKNQSSFKKLSLIGVVELHVAALLLTAFQEFPGPEPQI